MTKRPILAQNNQFNDKTGVCVCVCGGGHCPSMDSFAIAPEISSGYNRDIGYILKLES